MADRVYRNASRLHPALVPRERDARIPAERARRPLHQPPEIAVVVGNRAAVRPGLRLLRLVRRAHQLHLRRRLPAGRRDVRKVVAGQLPPDRQGHPDHAQRLLADHAQGDRPADAEDDFRAWLVADRQHEDVEVARQCHQPDGYGRPLRRRCVPLLPDGRNVARQRCELHRGELRGTLQQRSGERPRQSAEPCAQNDAAQHGRRDSAARSADCRRGGAEQRSLRRDRRDGNQSCGAEIRPGHRRGHERSPRRQPLYGENRAVDARQERRNGTAEHCAVHGGERTAADLRAALPGHAGKDGRAAQGARLRGR